MNILVNSLNLNFSQSTFANRTFSAVPITEPKSPEKKECFLLEGQDAYGRTFYKMMAALALFFAALVPINNWLYKWTQEEMKKVVIYK